MHALKLMINISSLPASGGTNDFKGGKLGFNLNLVITRKPNYIQRKIVVPVIILIVFMATSHMLPVESGERIGFSMTSILTMMITLQYAMEELPETDKEPMVIYYGRLIIFCMMFSLLLTTVIINLYHKKRGPMPRRMKAVVSILGRLLLVSSDKQGQVSDFVPKGGTEEDEQKDWIALANVLDRVSLIGLFLVAAVFLFCILSYTI